MSQQPIVPLESGLFLHPHRCGGALTSRQHPPSEQTALRGGWDQRDWGLRRVGERWDIHILFLPSPPLAAGAQLASVFANESKLWPDRRCEDKGGSTCTCEARWRPPHAARPLPSLPSLVWRQREQLSSPRGPHYFFSFPSTSLVCRTG